MVCSSSQTNKINRIFLELPAALQKMKTVKHVVNMKLVLIKIGMFCIAVCFNSYAKKKPGKIFSLSK
jgi:hypothetical protein